HEADDRGRGHRRRLDEDGGKQSRAESRQRVRDRLKQPILESFIARGNARFDEGNADEKGVQEEQDDAAPTGSGNPESTRGRRTVRRQPGDFTRQGRKTDPFQAADRCALRTSSATIPAKTAIDSSGCSTIVTGSGSCAAIRPASAIPISASPAISPDANSTPSSVPSSLSLRRRRAPAAALAAMPPIRIGTASENGRYRPTAMGITCARKREPRRTRTASTMSSPTPIAAPAAISSQGSSPSPKTPEVRLANSAACGARRLPGPPVPMP